VKGSTLQDAPEKGSPAGNARRASSRSAPLFRALRKFGFVFDALVIFAAVVFAASVEWHTALLGTLWPWRDGRLWDDSTWKVLIAFGGFALILLWISSHHHESALRKRVLLQEQKLNLYDCAISGLFLVSVLYVFGVEALPRGFVLFFLLLVTLGFGLRRLIFRTFLTQHAAPCNVLIVGVDPTALAIREQLRAEPDLGYSFRGFVLLSNSEPDNLALREDVVGTIDKLAEHVCKFSVGELFLTPSCSREMVSHLVTQARELGINSRMVAGHVRLAVHQRISSRL
jgi:FlaA1/EpsC-like NDP-sugar epimerase